MIERKTEREIEMETEAPHQETKHIYFGIFVVKLNQLNV